MEVSLTPSSCSLIIDTTTGALVPHFTELDHSGDPFVSPAVLNNPLFPRSLLLWPSKSLEFGRR
jgi:hypothetical protein